MAVVYKIVNKINNKIYIGSTLNSDRRWANHRSMLNRNIHHCKRLQYSWNKYGSSNFSFELIEVVNIDNYREREQTWVDHYKAADPNYGFNSSKEVLLGSKTYSYLSEEDVKNIIEKIESGSVRRRLAEKYKISPQTISDIAMGRSWSYLPRGKIRRNRWGKIPDEEIEKIKSYSRLGVPQRKIAKIYGVHQGTVSKIISGVRRKEVSYAV